MDGPWPEGAKQDLNQFEQGGRRRAHRGVVCLCILRRGGECLCVCRTNDVVSDHSCSPRGRCASGSLRLCRPGSRPCQKQDGRRGDGAHCEPQK
ncbi:unnamed protein product [Tetraodon nigroviridis]|uniref:(spotted green pufferfish) hypothetical protein n=1 Tax=Tetraodon nigroviridis TaxID=99883 RepID=Q4S3U5_TETNG|nr:unnamed protein product [Tetraodon nigroviridis]